MKGVIVLDVPESCSECPLESVYKYCELVQGDTETIDREEERLENCPIRPISQRIKRLRRRTAANIREEEMEETNEMYNTN